MSEQEGRVLVEHRYCRVTRHGADRLEATIGQRILGLLAAGGLATAGLFPLVGVPLFTGAVDMVTMSAGMPFVALSFLYGRNLSRNWGTLTVDAEAGEVQFAQHEDVKRWPFSEVEELKDTTAFSHSWRFLAGSERWLKLIMKDGRELPVLLGYPEELEAVREVFRGWKLPGA